MSDAKISVTFEEDHHRLDALFTAFQEQKRKDFAKAKEAFVALSSGYSATSCGKKIFFSPSGRRIPAWRKVARRRSCGRSID